MQQLKIIQNCINLVDKLSKYVEEFWRCLKMIKEHSSIQSARKGAHWVLSFFLNLGYLGSLWQTFDPRPTRTITFLKLPQRQPFGVTWARWADGIRWPQARWRPEISGFVGGTDGTALQCYVAAVDGPRSMALRNLLRMNLLRHCTYLHSCEMPYDAVVTSQFTRANPHVS